jgi:prepilin-type N-terminal cleavage/methylation domain-containing protein
MARQSSYTTGLQSGFTMVELLIVMSLIGLLATVAVVNLIKPQQTASLSGTVDVLVADLRGQQLRAMAGNTVSASTAQPHGVYIEPSRYTLYKGSVYSGSDTDNFSVEPEGVSLSTTFASSQVTFQKISGEPASFNASANTITVSNPAGETKTITINRFGIATAN